MTKGEKISLVLLGILIIVAGTLMIYSSRTDSATFDEVAHIPAGYSYVKYFDYRLNPEHPPLIKMLSGIPLLFSDINFPLANDGWTKEINGQWTIGNELLYNSGNNPDSIIGLARLGPIFVTLLLIFFVYFWSRKLMGKWWALLPATLTALSPNILAHGHYVTTDIGAALGIAAATYFFIQYLKESSSKNLLFAGLALGAAQVAKFSAVLLLPLFVFIAALHYVLKHKPSFLVDLLKQAGKLVAVFLVGYVFVVYPIYGISIANFPQDKQVEATNAIIGNSFGGPTPEGNLCNPKRCMAELSMFLNKYEATRPAGYYLFGVVMVIQRSDGGNGNYFWGWNTGKGSPYYFPTVYLAKEPLSTLLLFVTAIIGMGIFLSKKTRGIINESLKKSLSSLRDWASRNIAEISIGAFIVLYWYYSISSPLNIGYRHLMPIVPLTYILLSRIVHGTINSPRTRMAIGLIAAAAIIIETSIVSPHFLSFFNPVMGGTSQGYRIATDSNYDWGQDLKRLKEFVEENNIEKIAVDYFGGGRPSYYLEGKSENWWSAKGNPKDQGIEWLAISANTIQGSIQPAIPEMNRKDIDEYRWLTKMRPKEPGLGNIPKPDYVVGTSIFIYKF